MMTIRRQTIHRPTPSSTPRRRGPAGKRAFDVIVGTVAAIVATPVIIVLAIAMAISLRTWPFFVQRRVGRYGREFNFPKIRTLPASAPKYADKYAISEIELTRLGSWLRRTHLDELPQLYLVVAGTMSLVGPRPEMAALMATYPESFTSGRTAVRPGCTGLWQVSSASDGLIGAAPHFDLFYIHHATVGFDLWILWRTALNIVAGVEVEGTEDVPAAVLYGAQLSQVIDLTVAEVPQSLDTPELLPTGSEA